MFTDIFGGADGLSLPQMLVLGRIYKVGLGPEYWDATTTVTNKPLAVYSVHEEPGTSCMWARSTTAGGQHPEEKQTFLFIGRMRHREAVNDSKKSQEATRQISEQL